MKSINKHGIDEHTTKAFQAPSLGEGRGGCEEAGGGCQDSGVGCQDSGDGCQTLPSGCVCECNRAFHAETLHPLVSLIDMAVPCERGKMKTDCYAVVFRHNARDGAEYGRRPCDFTDGMLLFVAPNKELDLSTADGKMLIFHPSLIKCTPLGLRLKEYSFFKYRQDESLHISSCEEKVIKRCLGCISDELCWGVDDYSKDIISNAIDLLLGYCRRFYNRQFITRHEANADAIAALDGIIDSYMKSGRAATDGLPTTSFFARKLDMSAEYMGDMLKSETGKTTAEYVQLRRLSMAKQLLIGTDAPVGRIAETLGFSTAGCFATVFRKITGCTPEEYRGNE